MRLPLALMIAGLGACSTTNVETRSPVATYPSSQSRAQVRECLLNRFTQSDVTPRVQELGDATRIAFTGLLGQTFYSFTIRDTQSGSITEMRRGGSLAGGRRITETCF